jgi:hypothetical protein
MGGQLDLLPSPSIGRGTGGEGRLRAQGNSAYLHPSKGTLAGRPAVDRQ